MVRTYPASDASYQDHSKLAYETDRMVALCHHIAKDAQGMAVMEDNHHAATHLGASGVSNSAEYVQVQRPLSPSALDIRQVRTQAPTNDSNRHPSETMTVNPSQVGTSICSEEQTNS
jgi:hypothetical protein